MYLFTLCKTNCVTHRIKLDMHLNVCKRHAPNGKYFFCIKSSCKAAVCTGCHEGRQAQGAAGRKKAECFFARLPSLTSSTLLNGVMLNTGLGGWVAPGSSVSGTLPSV